MWADKSGNGNDLKQPTFNRQTRIIDSVINGLPVMALKTGGAQGRMKTDSNVPISNGVTIFTVASQAVSGLSPDGQGVFLEFASDSELKRNGSSSEVLSTLNADSVGNFAITDGVFYTFTIEADSADSSLFVNGNLEGGGSAFSAPSEQPFYIFQNHLNSNTGNKQFAQIIVYERILSTLEKSQIESYLQETYNHY